MKKWIHRLLGSTPAQETTSTSSELAPAQQASALEFASEAEALAAKYASLSEQLEIIKQRRREVAARIEALKGA